MNQFKDLYNINGIKHNSFLSSGNPRRNPLRTSGQVIACWTINKFIVNISGVLVSWLVLMCLVRIQLKKYIIMTK